MKSDSAAPVDDTARRKWDKEEFAERAKERELELEGSGDEGDGHRGGRSGPSAPRAPLRQRDFEVDLSSKLGKTQVIASAAPVSQQAGYYCEVCDCVVKDSANYLDHINGKKHQRALGMSMRVERSTVDQVKERFAALKRKQSEQQRLTEEDFELRLLRQQEEEQEKKKARKEKKKEKKKERQVAASDGLEGELDPEMAAMMGFAGFGGSAVN